MTYKKVMYKKRYQGRSGHCQSVRNEPAETRYTPPENECVSICREYGYPSLAMVYGASQCWRLINDGNDGFARGTIFDELNKPFMGDKCKNGGYCK